MPHVPQFCESVVVSVQPLAQGAAPEGQLQTPPLQLLPAGQALKHVPQLALSVALTTHTPLQDS